MALLDMTSGIELKNKKVTILGAARSGIAAANLVVRYGGQARLSEFKSQDAVRDELSGLDSQVALEFGGHTRDMIETSDFLILSPGVRQDIDPVRWARAKNIPVLGEIELGFLLCPCPIVAVTGSNGKTTVSTLIAECLKRSGRKVYLCGNIGQPFTKFIPDIKEEDAVVLEVSSFQLESTIRFRPHVGVLLNFSENHLDRHKDLDEYFDAKWKMFANQNNEDFAILNCDSPRMKQLSSVLKSRVSFFNSRDKIKSDRNPNELAVLEVSRVLGVSQEICLDVFRNFKGVEHRMELVRSFNGVDYINDSKSTTAEATRWALERLSKPAFWICGGRNKNIDFSVLKPLVRQKVKKVLAIGEAREKVSAVFSDVVPVERFDSLEAAVLSARMNAKSGECVMISPMCASFDMFKNFEHRGTIFKHIVNQLV